MKRDLKKELNRKLIVDAAYKLMTKKGIQKTSIKEVSELSGISFVTMYKYFKNKEELADAVALLFFKENAQELQKIADDDTTDFLTKFQEFSLKPKQIQQKLDSEISDEFLQKVNRSKAVQAYAKKWNQQFWQSMIKSGRAAGVINSDVADDVIGLFAGMFTQYVSTHVDDPKLMPQFERLFLYGIAGNQTNK
ncbi:TetR family transcriptional regulator [Pediococcus ethanolidurans]|uniref:TetR/AcrR family transcriptional regulator n=1 Tax=Pediococcus ethanolidurans TaxID=319653 RepID=UPI0029553232|nr:TetR/AcrR family transcriptional regulator [Pediococcus ethanolidurans]MDV7719810.1 TetR family transcriptional regulator [Pediococcus ethanolidurans]